MDTDKLKIDLFRYGTLVFGKVIHTPEILRSKEGFEKELGRLDEYTLSTCLRPELLNTQLYVHGKYKSSNDHIIYYEYLSEFEADKAIVFFKSIIDKINKNLEKEAEIC